ncbi:GNAT family N-acetyltransferase [Sphingomonas rubra]|uniref:Protein N-acetyltransferase, RimJ/RimL family n=1 Tax=Sphingomonas rubra TaxID=634430 RepID=A0A1I5QZC8_9SPHN|nr:GNAT family N-acetyltransferase [Sphingomonas rubra]SFP51431.1 Protein N-acetyltransferase, RimJ/RimL family [Sphingomonas rubra]
MFARTERLTLRPAWPEDAPALTAAIGHEQVARMLAHVPYPYTLIDADAWIGAPRGAHEPRFVIETREGDRPQLVGGIAIVDEGGGPEIGYWLTPACWGRGYATEAGRAVVEMARHALPIRRLGGRHFTDNPASGRVLRKLGFRPTGVAATLHSRARGTSAPSVEYFLDLDADAEPLPMAA